jgi:zinc/manganese transport system ATP-binding protein
MTVDPLSISLEGATLRLGGRTLWEDVSVAVPRGEFLAVLGPNGAGKTSLLRVLLGLQRLSRGQVRIDGHPPTRGSDEIGYVPQQRAFDPDLPLRGRDLVAFGLEGHRWGFSRRLRASEPVEDMLRLVRADGYADVPIGRLSGGEQQRLRIAQALVGDPSLLLCDEPLLSLDPNSQQAIVQLIAEWNRRRNATVVFVTHDINPLLAVVSRVLLLAGGRWAVGSVDQALTSETLSRLYGVPVEVLHVQARVVVLGAELGGHEPVPAAPIQGR